MNRPLSTPLAWMLVLLAPVLALAQGSPYGAEAPLNSQVLHSPLTWWWVAALVVAVVAFVGYTVKISRHGRPPHRPSAP